LLATLNKHKTDYSLIDIESTMRGMFMAVDTQDKGFYWVVRAVVGNQDTYLIDCGYAQDFDILEAEWNKERFGRLPLLGIIDQGGHRTKEVSKWVKAHKYWWKYRGESRISQRWKASNNDPLLILAQSKLFQSELLYYIYTAIQREIDGYWYLPADIDDMYCKHIISISPNNRKQNGEEYEEWVSHSKTDHFFDCEKMWLVIYDLALKKLKEKDWYQPLKGEKEAGQAVQPVRRVAKVPMYDEYLL